MALSSPGIGSGLDIRGLVNQLVGVAAQGPSARYDRQEAQLQAKLSGLGTLKSALSDFKSAISSLNSASTFTKTSSSNTQSSLFSVSTTSEASAGSYSVEVKSLAQSQKLASKSFIDTTSVVGTGTLTFRFGTYDSGGNTFTANEDKSTETVTISSNDNSLQGIRDAVNNAEIGVTATIVNDGAGNYLIFSSDDKGVKNSLEVTVVDDDTDPLNDAGLSQLAYDPTASVGAGKNLVEKVQATDAEVDIDGIIVKNDSNVISDAIEGVTLNLLKEELNTKASVTINKDRDAVSSAVNSFINSYNKLVGTANDLSSYNAETGAAGILIGDSTLRNVTSQVRRLLSNSIDGVSGAYRALIDLGVSTTDNGTLKLDKTKLNAALDDDFNNVAKIFSAVANADDSLITATAFGDNTQIGSHAINITQAATQGNYAGTATAGFPLVIDTDNDTFTISVDGTTSGTITLGLGTYNTAADLALEIQARINTDKNLNDAGLSVNVVYDVDHFVITSTKYGSNSTVSIVSGDTNTQTELGLSSVAGTQTTGLDVAGTIGGYEATGSGQILTATGPLAGLSIEVEGGATGSRGDVNFSRGIADQLGDLLDQLLASNGVLTTRTDSLSERIDDIGDQRVVLTRRLQSLEARYLAQFTALDSLVSQLQSTGNFLTQQLENLPKIKLSK